MNQEFAQGLHINLIETVLQSLLIYFWGREKGKSKHCSCQFVSENTSKISQNQVLSWILGELGVIQTLQTRYRGKLSV